MARRTDLAFLIAVMIALFAARVAAIHVSYDPHSVPTFDSRDYEDSALALVKTGRFAVSPDEPNTPQIRRTPGYPLLIAAIYKLKHDRRALLDVQAALSVLIVPMVFGLARRRWGRRGAWAATLLFAADPISFIHSGMILSETLFTLLLVAFLVAASNTSDRPRGAWAFAAGLALAAATLVRPIAFFLIVPMVIWFALIHRREAVKVVIAFVAPWVVLVGGWQARNYAAVGRPVLSTIGELNWYAYRAAGVIALRDHVSIQQARDRLDRAKPQDLAPADLDRWMGREGKRIVIEHPVLAARTQVVGLLKMLFGPTESFVREFLYGRFGNFGSVGWMAKTVASPEIWKWLAQHPGELIRMVYVELHAVVLYALAIGGLILIWRKPEKRSPGLDWLLWGVVLYFVVISAGPEATPRFRVPIVPIMAVLAGGVASSFFTRGGEKG